MTVEFNIPNNLEQDKYFEASISIRKLYGYAPLLHEFGKEPVTISQAHLSELGIIDENTHQRVLATLATIAVFDENYWSSENHKIATSSEEPILTDEYFEEFIVSRYSKKYRNVRLLTHPEEIFLSKMINTTFDPETSEKATQIMIEANLGLVLFVARKYENNRLNIPFEDLVQEGTIGLIRAVQKYDNTLGSRFSTYASIWIRQAILRYIKSSGRLIKLPEDITDLYFRIRRSEERLFQRLGSTNITDKEIAEDLGISINTIRFIRETVQKPISLDKPLGINGKANNERTLNETVRDTNSNIDYEISHKDFRRNVREYMLALAQNENQARKTKYDFSKREVAVLLLRSGALIEEDVSFSNDNEFLQYISDLNLDIPLPSNPNELDEVDEADINLFRKIYEREGLTLEEIAKIFGVTRERIRQNESAGFKKMRRQLNRIRLLRDPLYGIY